MEVRQFDDLGYSLTTIKTDKFKTNLISVSFQSEINRKTVTERSLLPYVLRSATEKYPSKKEINAYLESLYGASLSTTVEKRGKTHNVKFYLSLANEKFLGNREPLLEEGVELLKEVILNPLIVNGAFKEQVVEVEKRLLKEYIESIYDDKVSYALQKLVENMCKGEVFSTNSIGYVEDLNRINGQTLMSAYQQMLNENQISITVVGDIEHEKVYEIFKNHFDFQHRSINLTVIDSEDKEINDIQVIKEEQDIAQGKLNIGYRTHTRIGDEDYLPLLVFNGMFGGYAHSKLFMNVREKASLCYYCASRLDNYKGVMYVYSGIESENYEKAVKIIDEQLKDMIAGNFTDKEIELAKKSLINSKLESMDQASGMMAHEALNKLLKEPLTVEEWVNEVNSVTAEQIVSVAKKIKEDTIFFLTGKEVTE
ncbi:MAG: insulinase family protein [Turicibacter sp.]|nr:insulinase family protein [Turicibacter sp.]MBQ1785162.1 insulinase family protein [Turicibacter sp.]MEE0880497.1 pitrilysin family protein [Turicibacter sp.]MEE1236615.1 pitrilysin family protein [Turicibacter sp.]